MDRKEMLLARVRGERSERAQLARKLRSIRALADELGESPTLTRLIAFLRAVRELVREAADV